MGGIYYLKRSFSTKTILCFSTEEGRGRVRPKKAHRKCKEEVAWQGGDLWREGEEWRKIIGIENSTMVWSVTRKRSNVSEREQKVRRKMEDGKTHFMCLCSTWHSQIINAVCKGVGGAVEE